MIGVSDHRAQDPERVGPADHCLHQDTNKLTNKEEGKQRTVLWRQSKALRSEVDPQEKIIGDSLGGGVVVWCGVLLVVELCGRAAWGGGGGGGIGEDKVEEGGRGAESWVRGC